MVFIGSEAFKNHSSPCKPNKALFNVEHNSIISIWW